MLKSFELKVELETVHVRRFPPLRWTKMPVPLVKGDPAFWLKLHPPTIKPVKVPESSSR